MSSSSAPSSGYSEHERFANKADDYLDKHNVYDMFSVMLQKLSVSKPKDPYSFLISLLSSSPNGTSLNQLRVIVVGPPLPAYSNILDHLVREVGLVRVSLKELVQKEAQTNSALGKVAQQYIEQDNLLQLPEQIAIPLISARVNQPDAIAKGWILEGFPNTRLQALALQQAGILLTHMFYMQYPAELVTKHILTKDGDVRLFEHFQRHGGAVAECYSSVSHFLDGTQSFEALWSSAVLSTLARAPRSRAPRRPLRIFLLGKKGSGKFTQAHRLAQKYGVVHISVGDLLRTEIEKNPTAATTSTISTLLGTGIPIQDEILLPLLKDRLLKEDCKTHGFVLDGFPRTKAQVDFLAKLGITPNRVVVLELDDKTAAERVVHRRVDPLTSELYHLVTHPPVADSAIEARLIHRECDTEETTQALHEIYQQNNKDVVATYGEKVHTFDATAAVDSLFQQIEDFVLAPLNGSWIPSKGK